MKTTFTFLFPFFKIHRKKLFLLALFPFIWCLAETIAPYLIKILIDNLSEKETKGLFIIGIIYAVLMFIVEAAIRLCNLVWIKVFPKIQAAIQTQSIEVLEKQSLHSIQNQHVGDWVNKYRNLFESFEKVFRVLLYGIYPTALSFLISVVFIGWINPILAAVFFTWFVAMNLVTLLFYKKTVILAEKKASHQNLLVGYVGNLICNMITTLTFPRSLAREAAFTQTREESKKSTEKLEWITFHADFWRSLLSWMFLTSMILFIGFGWKKGWITLGDFAFITTVCFYARRSIWVTSLQLLEFFKELGITQEALVFLEHPSIEEEGSFTTENPSLDVQQVHFSYEGQKRLFENLNLTIPFGQKIGITGPSGAGKTTLIHLLLRVYDPFHGTISIGGHAHNKIPILDLRNLFSYVPQNPALMHTTIFDNIALGKSEATDAEVYEAARICMCEEFINRLEKGYHTVVGEGGYKLSGGERQRIALARAYLKNAPIFIWDEATSALDKELEELVLNNLLCHLKKKTVICISHRSIALQKMERVIMLKNGIIN